MISIAKFSHDSANNKIIDDPPIQGEQDTAASKMADNRENTEQLDVQHDASAVTNLGDSGKITANQPFQAQQDTVASEIADQQVHTEQMETQRNASLTNVGDGDKGTDDSLVEQSSTVDIPGQGALERDWLSPKQAPLEAPV